MKKPKKIITALLLAFACSVSGWILPACSNVNGKDLSDIDEETVEGTAHADDPNSPQTDPQPTDNNLQPQTNTQTPQTPQTPPNTTEQPNKGSVKPTVGVPQIAKAQYLKINADGVNIRSGAGAGYSKLGVAEKGTLYVLKSKSGDWYETQYLHKKAFISAKYCTSVQMNRCTDERVEKVIEEGYKCLGVPYVYGATRYHNGSGVKLYGFTKMKFDCSSLMQYIFKLGAGINLQVNTRTQIYQGKTVKSGDLKRGDLMFFTNSSRVNNTGIERVGHVALYLGDNYILHTASDYAKIERISSARWAYFIQAQRIL